MTLKMKLKGVWKSSVFIPDVRGEGDIIINEDNLMDGHDITGKITFDYKGKFRNGEHKIVNLKSKFYHTPEGDRYMLTSEELKCDQYFCLTLLQYKKDRIRGFYSCIFPCDVGELELSDSVKIIDFQSAIRTEVESQDRIFFDNY